MFHRQPQDETNVVTEEKTQSEELKNKETGKEVKEMSETSEVKTKEKTKDMANEAVSENNAPAVPGGVSFQKPLAGGARSSNSSFSGPYSGSQVSSVVSSSGTAEDRRLTIGRGITMSGEIESCDTLIVEGTVEAALKGAQVLDISETGVFYGTVEIEEAVISGRFEGDIVVNGRLTITSSGSVTGSIAYKELAIEAGATVDGRIAPLTTANVESSVPRNTGTTNSGSPVAKNDNAGELPFTGNVAAE
jgi:cytoskeletal protein CcmA (bactofilin family)